MSARDYRELRVWQTGMDLAVESYRLSRPFPRDERFGLTNQLRRAATSVVGNIAEGNGRLARREYLHHLSYARGSLAELGTYMELARRLEYVSASDLATPIELHDHVGRMLNRLIGSLRA